jgi:DnaJ-class molecular chaperone
VCGEDRYEPCEDCGGEGNLYLSEAGEHITLDEYNALPAGAGDYERCPTCGGEGLIEIARD